MNVDAGPDNRPSAEIIFTAALELKPEARLSYLAEACDGDGSLLERVEALLRAHDASSRFLPESPASISIGSTVTGRFIGDYELLEEIARGGMGIVFKARQGKLDRFVAVKMILAGGFASREQAMRFRAEVEAAARLQHPNIVRIHETGAQDGRPYFSMDYVEGGDLTSLVRDKPLPAQRAVAYVKTIAEAIHHAHEQGILHRDLKPSNVLIDSSDQPRVTDFGLAKRMQAESILTVTGDMMGSPNFMPPEQAGAKDIKAGRYSDVYSLGGILFYLVTSRPPFAAENIAETVHQVLNTEAISPRLLNPSIPQDLATICLKCLEKEPAKRYPTAQQLADELGRFLTNVPIHARPINRVETLWRWCRRKPVVASLGAATILLLLTVAIGSPIAAFRINRERQFAEEARKNETILRQQAQFREKLTRAETLYAQLKFEEADLVMGEVSAPIEARDARDGAALFRNLADYFARRGRWKEAAADIGKALVLEPDHVVDWIGRATLLMANGDQAAYRHHSRAMLARFGAIKEPNYAQRTAKVCLLLPVTGADLTKIAGLADSALSSGSNTWREHTKGLAEYRQGHFTNAVKWAEQVLAKPASATPTAFPTLYAQGAMLLAMAHHQLGQAKEARAALAKGIAMVETKLPKMESGDLGAYWVDRIITQVLMTEAKALVEGGARNNDRSK